MTPDLTALKTFRLDNGLTVLLKEIHTAPLISQWIWYRVGSRNEHPGITGISHFVEHILFKGTRKYPAEMIDRAIARDGGVMNGMTYLDWTTYFETMPSDKIDFSINMEADRMLNSQFAAADIESERTVIISEREGNENEPLFRLSEAVQAAAILDHPYHYEVIGMLQDLKKISRDDLVHHYQNYYSPSNALVAIAGDFQMEKMQEDIANLYGKVPSKKDSHPAHISAASPIHEKRIVIEGPGETTYLQIAYRAPGAVDKDFFAMTILDSILTGPASLNMFGGGISNKTSRLYQHLVEKDLAVSISGGLTATIDPYLFEISATVHPDKTPDEVIKAIDEEIDVLLSVEIPQDEIHRAVKQARALFAYGSENITNQAFWMGYSNIFATFAWFESYLEKLQAVTREDLIRTARNYLNPHRRIIGIYQPARTGGDR